MEIISYHYPWKGNGKSSKQTSEMNHEKVIQSITNEC